MKKEEYIEKRKSLEQQIKALESEYIETNTKYPIGTRLRITGANGKSRDGEVIGQTIDWNEVVPIVRQITKDGELSRRRIVIYESDSIETL